MEKKINQQPILVLGAGSWGTALAIVLAKNGNTVHLWAHNPDAVKNMAENRQNKRYLPDITFPPNIHLFSDIEMAIDGVSNVIIAVPSHAFKKTIQLLTPFIHKIRICSATKGLDPCTSDLLSQVVINNLGKDIPFAILSGPSFAKETASGLPTAITIASIDPNFSHDLRTYFHNDSFRVYTTTDITGIQLSGAIKNVLAIATGISDGLGYGANTRSAIITRGLAELIRLGLVMGGKLETFMGLGGIGDLILTCTDNQSRNRQFGLKVGAGQTLSEAEQAIGQVVEGYKNAKEVYYLAKKNNIEMPITEKVYQILYEGLSPKNASDLLLSREPKSE
ncbi:MAG: Glycerol-3-phosphate dehydrogenase [NAD(P)+] [Legionellaceae bacterium]